MLGLAASALPSWPSPQLHHFKSYLELKICGYKVLIKWIFCDSFIVFMEWHVTFFTDKGPWKQRNTFDVTMIQLTFLCLYSAVKLFVKTLIQIYFYPYSAITSCNPTALCFWSIMFGRLGRLNTLDLQYFQLLKVSGRCLRTVLSVISTRKAVQEPGTWAEVIFLLG